MAPGRWNTSPSTRAITWASACCCATCCRSATPVDRALVMQGVAEVVAGLGVVRREADGLAVLGNGLVHLALGQQCDTEVVVGFVSLGESLADLEGLAVLGDGLVQPALVMQGPGATLKVQRRSVSAVWRQPQAALPSHLIALHEQLLAKGALDVRYQLTPRLDAHARYKLLRRHIGRLRPVSVCVLHG
jgi:hypothetical protein